MKIFLLILMHIRLMKIISSDRYINTPESMYTAPTKIPLHKNNKNKNTQPPKNQNEKRLSIR